MNGNEGGQAALKIRSALAALGAELKGGRLTAGEYMKRYQDLIHELYRAEHPELSGESRA